MKKLDNGRDLEGNWLSYRDRTSARTATNLHGIAGIGPKASEGSSAATGERGRSHLEDASYRHWETAQP